MLGGAAARGVLSGGLSAIRAGTAMGSAASTAYALGQEAAGEASIGAGLGGVARAAGNAARASASDALGLGAAAERGRNAAWTALSGTASSSEAAAASGDSAPAWARQLRTEQAARQHRHAAFQALREGDRGGASAHPDIKERED